MDTKTVSNMEHITSKGLPFIVQYLLDGQCARTDTILEYKISCSGKATQLTLTWTPVSKNSTMPTQACPDKPPSGYKKKTPSDKKRDSIRKQQFIEKKKEAIKKTVDSSKVCENSKSKAKHVEVKSTGPRTRSKAKLIEDKQCLTVVSSNTPELKRALPSESGSDNLFYSPASIGSIETGRLDASWNSDLESQPPWSVRSEENQVTELLEHKEINSSTPDHMDSDDNSDYSNENVSENDYDSCDSQDPYGSLRRKLKQLEVCFNEHYGHT